MQHTLKQSESCSKRRSEIRDFAFGSNDAFTAIEPTLNSTEVARYKSLNDALEHTPSYEVIDLNGFVQMEPWRKYKCMKGLKVRYRCIRYTHVSGKTTLNFVWRVPVYDEKTEVLNKSSELKDSILKEIPLYHTRAMRREFVQSFGSVCNVKSCVLREAYKRLTGDATTPEDSTEKGISKRISEALDMFDPELLVDLRVNNAGRPEQYELFLEEFQKYISGEVETVET